MPIRKCDNPKCRKPYQFSKPQSRFCSDSCRAANKGAPKPERARQREWFVSDHPDTDPIEILKMRRDAKRLLADGRIDEGNEAYARAMALWNALPPSTTNPNAETW
jgi:hypothetical protein